MSKDGRDAAELGRDVAGVLITLIEGAPDMPGMRKWRGIKFPEEWRAYWRMREALKRRQK
jgi:hypothetical protein